MTELSDAILRLDNAALRLKNGEGITKNLALFAADIETLIRAASTPSPDAQPVSEEDKARALRHLNECQEKGWALFLKENIETIQRLLLPTPRGEGKS